MDAADRLLNLAAMGSPERAPAAWAEWRRLVPQAEASGLLMWAGGYINRNLRAAGVQDTYLAGITRYNFLRNNTQILAALPVIRDLTAAFDITPMKSFGLSEAVSARSLRPLADFDFYAFPDDVEPIRARLLAAGLEPLLAIGDDEFRERIHPQRGSWNFVGPDGVDIDLHWRIFDHLDVDDNAGLVRENSRTELSEFGPIRRLGPEIMALSLIMHGVVSGDRGRALFDIVHVLRDVDPDRFGRLVRETALEREVARVHDDLRAALGDDVPAAAEVLGVVVAGARRRVPHAARAFGPPRFARVAHRFLEPTRWRDAALADRWARLGRPAVLERRLIARGGPLARPEAREPEGGLPAGGARLGSGWFHRFPRDGYRWAMLPDARAVHFGAAAARTLVIDIDPVWSESPNTRVDVFVDGHRVGRMTRAAYSYRFALPPHGDVIEVSLRPTGLRRFRDPGIHYREYGFLAPIARLAVE